MIGVKIQGRLGNQMFQYAFAYAAARRQKTLFFIDGASRNKKYVLSKYFKLRSFENIRQRVTASLYHKFLKKRNDLVLIQHNNKEGINNFVWHDNAFYEGFFQSKQFFAEYEQKIKRIFRIKKNYVQQFHYKYGQIFEKHPVAVIHVRRTDYIEYGNDSLGGKNLTLPLSFFQNAIQHAGGLTEHHVIFISDDLEYIQNAFERKNNYFFEKNSEIIDFQLLKHADVLIISNSSFAWWGAFLNEKKDVKIYAPKHWLGFKINQDYPVGIVSGLNWKWVDVK